MGILSELEDFYIPPCPHCGRVVLVGKCCNKQGTPMEKEKIVDDYLLQIQERIGTEDIAQTPDILERLAQTLARIVEVEVQETIDTLTIYGADGKVAKTRSKTISVRTADSSIHLLLDMPVMEGVCYYDLQVCLFQTDDPENIYLKCNRLTTEETVAKMRELRRVVYDTLVTGEFT